MTRKGREKVRTGCKTCKIRKVKCDETWPQCLRCQKTGRTCSGYQAPPAGSLSWNVLLRPQPSVTPVCDNAERRSLAYFHQVVAPVLSGPLDPSFWTYFVAQATHHQPTARHAVLAISSLFENFSETTLKTTDDPFALRHYNKAINGLLTNPGHDIDTILTVCVLFICIEFLRGDDKAAVDHTRHGVKLLNEKGGSSQLAAVFCHINLFPLFFGTAVDDVPLLITNVSMPQGSFKSMLEAKHHLDIMMVRTVWLVRRSEHWQIGVAENSGPTPDMFEEQRELTSMFARWGHSFARFQASEGIEINNDSSSLALKIRWLTSSIWVRNCLTRGESAYDKYKTRAENIVKLARSALALSAKSSAGRPKKFMFDMGFSPILHFVVLKCRYLNLRLQALALLKGLACRRESLWDAVSMQAVCRKVIEVEHGIELGPDALERANTDFADVALPAEMDRVRGYNLEDAHLFRTTEPAKVHRRPVCFFMHGENGGVALRREWVTITT